MTRLTRLCRTVGVGLAVVTATLAMTQAADAAPKAPPVDTTTITPTSGQVFLVGHAKGVQIYKCQSATANGTTTFSWTFVEPRADLLTDNGQLIKHSKGPTWTAADGSAVSLATGQKPTSVPSSAPDRDIPWLLVPVGPAPNSAATGLLTGTTSIQRLNTKGGTAPPTAECKAQTADKVKEVPYKADYYFWK
jgi:hypothetical protein